jgi:hypothetical protein
VGGCQTLRQDALAGEETLKERGRDMALLEVGIVEDAFVERDGRLDAFDHEFVEGSAHTGDGFLPVPSMRNDFGNHGVVERDDHHVGLHDRVDSHTESAWRAVLGDHSRTRRKFFWIFGVDAAFETMPDEFDVLLFEREGLPVSEPDLFLDEIDAGHHFGDSMFDLNAGVYFHEEEVVVFVEQELDGADIPVVYGFDGFDGDATDGPAEFLVDGRRRRLFEQLLVPALDRAVSLPKMHDMSTVVGDNLHFDMAGFEKISFEIDRVVAERGLRLRLRRLKCASEILGLVHDPHAASAST